MSTPPRPTYDSFVLLQMMPAPGWQYVFWNEDHHALAPIHALALAERRTYLCFSHHTRAPGSADPPEELREVVGLEYTPADYWTVVESLGNYCGLLPPGMTLAEFVALRRCHPSPATGEQSEQEEGLRPDDPCIHEHEGMDASGQRVCLDCGEVSP